MIISRISNVVEGPVAEKNYDSLETQDTFLSDHVQHTKFEKLTPNGALRLFYHSVYQFVSFSINVNDDYFFNIVSDSFLNQEPCDFKGNIPSFKEFPILPNLTCSSNWSFNMPSGFFSIPNSYLFTTFYAKYIEYVNLILRGNYEKVSSGFPDYIPSYETLKYILQYYLQTTEYLPLLDKIKTNLIACTQVKRLISNCKYELASDLLESLSKIDLIDLNNEKIEIFSSLVNVVNDWRNSMASEIKYALNCISNSVLHLKTFLLNDLNLENQLFLESLNVLNDNTIEKWFIDNDLKCQDNEQSINLILQNSNLHNNELLNLKISNNNVYF